MTGTRYALAVAERPRLRGQREEPKVKQTESIPALSTRLSHPSDRICIRVYLFLKRVIALIRENIFREPTDFNQEFSDAFRKTKTQQSFRTSKKFGIMSLSRSKLKLGPVHGRNHIVTYYKFSTRNIAKRLTFE